MGVLRIRYPMPPVLKPGVRRKLLATSDFSVEPALEAKLAQRRSELPFDLPALLLRPLELVAQRRDAVLARRELLHVPIAELRLVIGITERLQVLSHALLIPEHVLALLLPTPKRPVERRR